MQIKIDRLGLQFKKNILLGGFSHCFVSGQFVSVLGANGTGKSTFLKTLAGLHQDYNGSVFFNDENIKQLSVKNLSTHCAYVPPAPVCHWPLTVRQILSIVFPRLDQKNPAIQKLNIGTLLCQRFQTLSSGEKARVMLAQALLRNTPVLILDEITSHLDESTEAQVMEYLAAEAKHKIIILATHQPKMAMHYCHTVLQFKNQELHFMCHKTPTIRELTL